MEYFYLRITSHRYIGTLTLLAVNTTEHERPVYIGMTGMIWGAGTVLGPVSTCHETPVEPPFQEIALTSFAFQIVGGAFTKSSVGWRFAFYINRESYSCRSSLLCTSLSPRKSSFVLSLPQYTYLFFPRSTRDLVSHTKSAVPS